MTEHISKNFSTLVGLWIGDLRGTSFGNVFAETSLVNESLKFRITTSVQNQQTIFEGSLSSKDGKQIVALDAVNSPEAAKYPKPHAIVDIDTLNENEINGRWSTANGHSGVVWLKRVSTGDQSPKNQSPAKPAELLAKEVSLPKFTLYREELEILVGKLRTLINTGGDAVITTRIDSNDVTQFATDFLRRQDLPPRLSHLKLNINDGRQPLQNSISVVLSNLVPSQFIVQSDNAIWMNGVYMELRDFFARYTNRLVTYFQQYGLNINGLFLLAVVATLPELSLVSRYVFLALTLLLVILFMKVHSFINSTRIYTSPKIVRGWVSTETPRIKSGIVTAILAGSLVAIAAGIYRVLLESGSFGLLNWISYLIGR